MSLLRDQGVEFRHMDLAPPMSICASSDHQAERKAEALAKLAYYGLVEEVETKGLPVLIDESSNQAWLGDEALARIREIGGGA